MSENCCTFAENRKSNKSMALSRSIKVQDTTINVLLNINQQDYISLTDMSRGFEEGPRLIEKWLNNKSTIDFLGVWEQLNNPNFKTPEFGGIRMEAGSNRFYMSVNKFIERNAELIKRGVDRAERFEFLQQMAIDELKSDHTNVEQQFKRLATKYPPAITE